MDVIEHIKKEIKDCDQRFYFFNARTAQGGNNLTNEIVLASSTDVLNKQVGCLS